METDNTQTSSDENNQVTPATDPAAQPATSPPAEEPVTPATEAPAEAVPTPEAAPEAPAADAQAAPSDPNHQKKVLLVEDDDNLASVYQMRLEAENFEVQRVPNGEDALAAALQFKPDLILLDVMMPKVSGFDVLDILRNTPETANIRIIMLTALGQEADQQRAKDLGVDDYLVKSQVVLADVVERIKTHLNM